MSSFSGIPEHFWEGTVMQKAAIRRFMLTEKFVYDLDADEELKDYAKLTGVPLDQCIFDRPIFEFIKHGKELPCGHYYNEFREQWEKRKK